MSTRIRANATFSNKNHLDHLPESTLNLGEETIVDEWYAEQLQQNDLVDILEKGVTRGSDGSEGQEVGEAGTGENGEPEPGESTEAYAHTDLVGADGTLTDEFPYRSILENAEIDTVDDLKFFQDDFQDINQIGAGRAENIREAWEEVQGQ